MTTEIMRPAISIFILFTIIGAETSMSINKHYTSYTGLDGYICYGDKRVFLETGLDLMSCAINCGLKGSCTSYMFKEEGGYCYGCNWIFTSPTENTAYLLAEQNAIYHIDTDFETIFRFGSDSMKTNEGRVEIRYNGAWGTVCDDRWFDFLTGYEINNVNVLCASLGFNKGGVVLDMETYPMANSAGVPIWLDNVECNGTEQNIAECTHNGFGINNCGHDEDVSVKCIL